MFGFGRSYNLVVCKFMRRHHPGVRRTCLRHQRGGCWLFFPTWSTSSRSFLTARIPLLQLCNGTSAACLREYSEWHRRKINLIFMVFCSLSIYYIFFCAFCFDESGLHFWEIRPAILGIRPDKIMTSRIQSWPAWYNHDLLYSVHFDESGLHFWEIRPAFLGTRPENSWKS